MTSPVRHHVTTLPPRLHNVGTYQLWQHCSRVHARKLHFVNIRPSNHASFSMGENLQKTPTTGSVGLANCPYPLNPCNPPIHNPFTYRFIDLTGATPDFPGHASHCRPCLVAPRVADSWLMRPQGHITTLGARVDETRSLRLSRPRAMSRARPTRSNTCVTSDKSK